MAGSVIAVIFKSGASVADSETPGSLGNVYRPYGVPYVDVTLDGNQSVPSDGGTIISYEWFVNGDPAVGRDGNTFPPDQVACTIRAPVSDGTNQITLVVNDDLAGASAPAELSFEVFTSGCKCRGRSRVTAKTRRKLTRPTP